MINPYIGVDWANDTQVTSCSHEHCVLQSELNVLTQNSGIQHIALSNYYPSEPYYPLSDFFATVPSGCIGSPNAEHHNMSLNLRRMPSIHLNSLGSTFRSGKPNGEEPIGCNGAEIKDIISQIMDELQYQDAGGVTINHPCFSHIGVKEITEILGFDDRVLGIEIFNGSDQFGDRYGQGAHPERFPIQLEMWDEILFKGIRCWGFFVADHTGKWNPDWWGRNVLLVNDFTEHDCLKAYRDGAFYGRLKNTNLRFTNIQCTTANISVQTENASYIDIIIDKHATRFNGNTASLNIPTGATYARIEAKNSDDSIYSNPMIFRQKKSISHKGAMLLLD